MSELKPCPICWATLKIYSPEDWKPTFYDPDSGGDPYNAVCDCGFQYSSGSYDYAEFVAALNRRAQPANSRFADCHIWEPGDKLDTLSDKCDVLIKAEDIKALMQPANEPLTPEDLPGMVGSPVWISGINHYGILGEWPPKGV